ncbi:MAG TPA: DUF4386 domain-containing protein [Candidatus Limnocylindrales bacterium]
MGKITGALFLLAFAAYGTGSALAGSAAGTALTLLNSVIVATIGVLVFRALRPHRARAAWIYLTARGAEAALLGAGVILLNAAQPQAADTAYQFAMLALGLGSLPFCAALPRAGWVPRWLAVWGFLGYALLAAGSLAALGGTDTGLLLSIPGGLFEVVFGVTLLYKGFSRTGRTPGTPDPRRASLVAGLGLLVLSVTAGIANVGVLERLVTGDAAETTARMLADRRAFQLAILGLSVVAVLDVVVAWALWAFFDRVHHTGAVVAAWLRTIYAAVFGAAITYLVAAELQLPGSEMFAQIGRFHDLWDVGLILFGAHLAMLGWLSWRSGTMPRFVAVPLAVLLAVAGAGYLIDSIGRLAFDGYSIGLSAVTFAGEAVLMVWLLIFALRRPGQRPPAQRPRPSDLAQRPRPSGCPASGRLPRGGTT